MVNIKIVVEGGLHPNDNNSAAATYNNDEKFRESFHTLLSNIFPPSSFNLVIEPGASYTSAIKSFRQQLQNGNCILLIDLDCPKTEKATKLAELTLTAYTDHVFFMVQEMEAWILSQPGSIIKTYSENIVSTGNLEDDDVFKLIPEEIANPTYWLGIVLSRYFRYDKNGVTKKKKYGKLKDGPLLLAHLDMAGLIETFEDVKRLNTYLENN